MVKKYLRLLLETNEATEPKRNIIFLLFLCGQTNEDDDDFSPRVQGKDNRTSEQGWI